MATQLHQQLKAHYAQAFEGRFEAVVGSYRIDVQTADRLIEVQQASLSALRDKTRKLLREHAVTIVKPIVNRKTLVKLSAPEGEVLSRRLSPKRGDWWQAFDELIYFRELFPNPRLQLDLVLVDVEETRVSKPARRFKGKNYRAIDRSLLKIVETRTLIEKRDPLGLLPGELPEEFDTGELALAWKIPRYVVQRIAYFLREIKLIEIAGKKGRSMRYRLAPEEPMSIQAARKKRKRKPRVA